MGRRALRKLDPILDLSRHFRLLEELPAPLDADFIFGRNAPLEVEVGSGKGLFLQSACETHPERNFLGIELADRYARYCAGRLARKKLANGFVVSGDAVRFFQAWLADASLAGVHVYFPDPWWKKRHRKRRVMSELFLQQVARVLQPGGTLHFWTDVEEYFHTTLELIATTTRLRGPEEVPERPAEHELDYRTHFERRMRLQELPVFRSRFVK
jgi:tRNA (guanine-N7-)-methyltransferase